MFPRRAAVGLKLVGAVVPIVLACCDARTPQTHRESHPERRSQAVGTLESPPKRDEKGWWELAIYYPDNSWYHVEVCAESGAEAERLAKAASNRRAPRLPFGNVDVMSRRGDAECSAGAIAYEGW